MTLSVIAFAVACFVLGFAMGNTFGQWVKRP
jgi:hypothetical protein